MKRIRFKHGNEKAVEEQYEVGDLYLTTKSENPSVRFGGTWELFGPGRTLVCVDKNDKDFNTVKKTLGTKTQALTTAQLPSHNHSYNKVKSPTGGPSNNTSGSTTLTVNQIPSHNHGENINGQAGNIKPYTLADAKGGKTSGFFIRTDVVSAYTGPQVQTANTGGGTGHTHTLSSHTHTTSTESATTGNQGGGEAHNNLQPLITCYIWIRTA